MIETFAPTPPLNPSPGDEWTNTTTGERWAWHEGHARWVSPTIDVLTIRASGSIPADSHTNHLTYHAGEALAGNRYHRFPGPALLLSADALLAHDDGVADVLDLMVGWNNEQGYREPMDITSAVFAEDSGGRVRRRFHFEIDRISTGEALDYGCPGLLVVYGNQSTPGVAVSNIELRCCIYTRRVYA